MYTLSVQEVYVYLDWQHFYTTQMADISAFSYIKACSDFQNVSINVWKYIHVWISVYKIEEFFERKSHERWKFPTN